MSVSSIQIERTDAVAHVWLNRPDVHNAFDAALIAELTTAFEELSVEDAVRVVILGGRGRSFSAGAQVQWMMQQGAATAEENLEDARLLGKMFQSIAECTKPTVARVHGAAIGGGVGLAAACDIAIGTENASFATSEVRLGLIPATIAPYVVRAIGERQARRYFLTAERMDAPTAQRIGLIHEVVPMERLDERIGAVAQALFAGAPVAQRNAKILIESVAGMPVSPELMADTAQRIAKQRSTPEAREGLAAFIEKRPARWSKQP